MNFKDITVIILLYNTPNKILENLRIYRKFKVAVLDQSNDHQSKKKLKKILPNIIYYKVTRQNNGFSKGINFLVRKVKTKFFLCTQPDVKISVKSILNLKKVFFKKKDSIISVPNIKNSTHLKIQTEKLKIKKTQKFIGAVFLGDKDKFKKIKMFDEFFFFYWEDEDLSKRIELSNYNIYLCQNSLAFHDSSKSTKSNVKSSYIRTSSFKFGEYFYQYKYKRLKLIKIIREPLSCILFIFFYLIIFNKNKALNNLFKLIGIFKFFKFFLIKKI